MKQNITLFSTLLVKVHFLSASIYYTGRHLCFLRLRLYGTKSFLTTYNAIYKKILGNKKTIFPMPTDIRACVLLIKRLVE